MLRDLHAPLPLKCWQLLDILWAMKTSGRSQMEHGSRIESGQYAVADPKCPLKLT